MKNRSALVLVVCLIGCVSAISAFGAGSNGSLDGNSAENPTSEDSTGAPSSAPSGAEVDPPAYDVYSELGLSVKYGPLMLPRGISVLEKFKMIERQLTTLSDDSFWGILKSSALGGVCIAVPVIGWTMELCFQNTVDARGYATLYRDYQYSLKEIHQAISQLESIENAYSFALMQKYPRNLSFPTFISDLQSKSVFSRADAVAFTRFYNEAQPGGEAVAPVDWLDRVHQMNLTGMPLLFQALPEERAFPVIVGEKFGYIFPRFSALLKMGIQMFLRVDE